MIYKNKKEITLISKGDKIISEIYIGTKLIWQYIKSCFGKGFWINDKGWDNKDGWRNK